MKEHCSKNPAGYSFWKSKFKNDRPHDWPIQKERTKAWSEEEIERTLEALSYLPSSMSRDDIRGLYRMEKSISFPNQASSNHHGDIVLYDNVFGTKNNLSQILSHEIAHRIFDSLSEQELDDYRHAAGWVNFSDDKSTPDYVLVRKKMVDPDSANSTEEDFSNNIEFYLFNPVKLKDVCPSAYIWISKHFGANFKLGKGEP